MRVNTSSVTRRPKRFSLKKMFGSTSRLVSAMVMSSVLFSMHQINTFYSTQFERKMTEQPEELLAPPPPPPPAKQSFSKSVQMHVDHDDDFFEKTEVENKRAIVIISMGTEASNTTMVERFVWSARNIGKFNGYIILITDADEDRYANMAAAELSVSNSVGYIVNTRVNTFRDTNVANNFLVFRTQDKRFIKSYTKKKFKSTNTMNSKIFKTYILKFANKELKLADVELFYYLDVDIVFGNPIQPLFAELEERYDIGNLYKPPLEEGTSAPTDETDRKAPIYFFEGNGEMKIQGGQFVLDRERSQPCLSRWRTLMLKQRNRRYLKDQTQLTMMLNEQWERANTIATNDTTTNSTTSSKPDCEIVLMKQNASLIQFPEVDDIKNRPKNQEHPVLIHFRNSGKVMRNVDEESLQSYMRDILRFKDDQEDVHGILNKMLMKVDLKKKGRKRRRTNTTETNTTEHNAEEDSELLVVEHVVEQDGEHEEYVDPQDSEQEDSEQEDQVEQVADQDSEQDAEQQDAEQDANESGSEENILLNE